jgi:hypothetical protein
MSASSLSERPMPLHLQKLCVGCASIEDLQGWLDERMAVRRREGRPLEQIHTTRMAPKRVAELLDGGSLYWVIKGVMNVRQPLLDLRSVRGDDGIERCDLVLEPMLAPVRPIPRRPFQGWRYLAGHEAPPDLADDQRAAPGLPPHLIQDLRALGLL